MKIKHWRNKVVILSILLTACAYKRPMTEPITQVHFPALVEVPVEQRQLLVFLPGIGGKLADFERYDFIHLLQQRYPTLDITLVDAHFAYYRNRVILDRLQNDVILPAKNKGYCQIHLAGISLGGFGSLLYMREYGDAFVSSFSLLAPYMGEPTFYAHVLDPAKTPQAINDPLNLWPWLSSLTAEQKQLIYLAYGEQDKLLDGQNALASLLPSEHSFTIAGKHRWPVWRALLQQGLASGQLLPAMPCP